MPGCKPLTRFTRPLLAAVAPVAVLRLRDGEIVQAADAVMDAETGDSFIDLVPFRPSFNEVPENRYLVTQLHSAMARLPERERAILQLSFFDELTHDEISLRLGLTRARMGQLVNQAIARLRKTLVQ